MKHFKSGERIKLKTGNSGIFEDYCITDEKKCFVIIDPDYDCIGSQLIKLKEIETYS